MRKLLGALTLGMLLGCGGEDESLVTATKAEAVQSVPDEMLQLAEQPNWTLVFNEEALRFELVQLPVEERFFYETQPCTTPPATPPPPCPTCW